MSGGAMPKQEKVERVAELTQRIEGSDALLLTEYRGLTVSEITELRRSLGEGGTKFQVVKNTLMRRAVNDAGVAELESLLEGPSAVAFVEGDPVAAAKSVVDAAKKYPTLVLKGGFMDGKMLSADDAKALAALESREVMLSKIAGLMKSEMTKAAALFVGAQSKFLSLLEAYKEKVPGEVVADDAASSTAADAAESSAADSAPESTDDSEEPQAEGAEDGGAGSPSADSAASADEAPEAETAESDTDTSNETPEAAASDEEE
jgi:large subunit ribosomal protein L10